MQFDTLMVNRIHLDGENTETMLEHDVRQEENTRIPFEAERKRMKLQIADAIFDDLVGETCRVLNEIEANT